MRVEDELMNTNVTAQNWTFKFSEIIPIVISIVLQVKSALQGPNVYSK